MIDLYNITKPLLSLKGIKEIDNLKIREWERIVCEGKCKGGK